VELGLLQLLGGLVISRAGSENAAGPVGAEAAIKSPDFLNYLARYTHRVAISNHRLVACENHRVSVRWRDYAHGGKNKVMTVPAEEFLRRFLIHVLPKGLVRIRHFGLFANRRRAASLQRCRSLLGMQPCLDRPASASQPPCPLCSGRTRVAE
jgi:hypothetical protein